MLKTLGTSTFICYRSLSQLWIVERINWLIGNQNVTTSDFVSILYSKSLRENRKPKFKIGDEVRMSGYDWSFRKRYRSQFMQKFFEIVVIASKKPPTYTLETDQDETILGNFYRKELIEFVWPMDSFPIELVSNASAKLFLYIKLSSFVDFAGAT